MTKRICAATTIASATVLMFSGAPAALAQSAEFDVSAGFALNSLYLRERFGVDDGAFAGLA
jgi:hypothetical protein